MSLIDRQRLVADELADQKLDALVVTHLPNVRYLTGFTGSAGVLIMGPRKPVFITDGRYTSQAREQVQGAKIVISTGPALEAAAKEISRQKFTTIGIEAEHMPVSLRTRFKKLLGAKAKLKETSNLVERIRWIKDPGELAAIERAVQLGADIFKVALKAIRPGVLETDVAAELEYAARKRGAEGMSFETIVASGPRSALPHGVASTAAIPAKGFVVLDFGVILGGYCSDMTRTVHVGKPSPEARSMYQAVLESQLAGIEAVRAGATAGDVDFACRNVLRNKKLGRARLDRFFTHSTGHGVGIEIHELPRLARNQQEPLASGMVVTIEPGIYIEGKGGIRIEDMVAVTDNGCEVLTPVSKELIVL
jgi:Xaa-Pro aminopeptidase